MRKTIAVVSLFIALGLHLAVRERGRDQTRERHAVALLKNLHGSLQNSVIASGRAPQSLQQVNFPANKDGFQFYLDAKDVPKDYRAKIPPLTWPYTSGNNYKVLVVDPNRKHGFVYWTMNTRGIVTRMQITAENIK